MKCKYCGAEILDSCSRCRDCGSWLKVKSFLFSPENFTKIIGLFLSFVAAFVAWQQALDARKERKAADELKKDIVVIAENVTKMSYVLADGSVYFDGIPKQHMQKIDDYKNAIKKYLPPTIDKDIKDTLKELKKGVKK